MADDLASQCPHALKDCYQAWYRQLVETDVSLVTVA
uniref:Uncharacterized protein n=1 Tax=Anguilla anguilla TaxID=7936 RepID=A0A0E9RJ47_ANGAN